MSRPRTAEPAPAWVSCRWLKRCHGADILRAGWLELELWAPTLWMALRIPRSAETAKVAIAANLPRQHVDDR